MLEFNCLRNPNKINGGYIVIPKILLSSKYYRENLSITAIIIYAWLKDKLHLSLIQEQIDINGDPFILITIPIIMKHLHLSRNTVRKAIRELEVCRLVKVKSFEPGGKRTIIYLGEFDSKIDSHIIKMGLNIEGKKGVKKSDKIGTEINPKRGGNSTPYNTNNNTYTTYGYMNPFDFEGL